MTDPATSRPEEDWTEAPVPLALLAELTHRCPLSCPYCSNPLELTRRSSELSTEEWIQVFAQAAAMGVLQVHLSGGEPAARRDLPDLILGAAKADLYTNLITSGVSMKRDVFEASVENGLDHVQLSVQGSNAETADLIGGYEGGFDIKMQVAQWVVDAGLPLTINAVVHRKNLDTLPQTIDLAERLGARRLEIAHTQYHGWGLKNRATLMPTIEQVMQANEIVRKAQERLTGILAIDYVTPDHFTQYPKACMGGWARTGLNVAPDGTVLPCHAAQTIPSLTFETVRQRSLADIWQTGSAFTAYRGVEWMDEPCRSCDRKNIDWGGCRCQAFAINGDAATTDPACSLSSRHSVVRAAANPSAEEAQAEFDYRKMSRD